MTDTLLIIEDEKLLATELKRRFERQDWEVHVANDLDQAESLLVRQQLAPTVVLADLSLPDGNSLDRLEQWREGEVPLGEWVFLTAYGSIPDSVRAVQLGAFDFLEKPYKEQQLDLVVSRAARTGRAQRRLEDLSNAGTRQYSVEQFMGRSLRAMETREILSQIAQASFSALIIRGETGTGKGLAARILHYGGARWQGPMVEVNCAALPRELLESELFGHEAGAFTGAKGRRRGLFEQASGGTLFLDEIAEMDLGLQSKLLKAVEDKRIRRVGGDKEIEANVQIIAATNRDPNEAIREGSLREDLFHRLSVFQIELPPLRDRLEDLEDLVPAFIEEFNHRSGKQVREIPPSAWEALRAHSWPGNVRELRNVLERAVLLSGDELLQTRWLQLGGEEGAGAGGPRVNGDQILIPLDGSLGLDEIERCIIGEALERCGRNVSKAARLLGVTRQTLRYRVEKHGLKGDGEAVEEEEEEDDD